MKTGVSTSKRVYFRVFLAVSGFCHGGAPVFLLVLALCCRSTCHFRRNSEKSNHMLSATSRIELELLTKFLNMSKLQNRLILLYQSLPLHRRLPHVKFYLPKRSQNGKRASQSLTTTSGKFE